jgi:uncharacterized coiled-coil protein SlyX
MDVNKKVNQHDEMIAEMWKLIDRIKADLTKLEKRMDKAELRNAKADRRADLMIKRLVKLESFDVERDRRDAERDKRMAIFDEKLEQSLTALKETTAAQAKVNKYFLDYIRKNPIK